uniref:Uncharacterized protein n=1 Tax=Trichogramma kaykai TaxID=54128 RepID=A0ABD2XJH2_9HYME
MKRFVRKIFNSKESKRKPEVKTPTKYPYKKFQEISVEDEELVSSDMLDLSRTSDEDEEFRLSDLLDACRTGDEDLARKCLN